MDNIIIVIKSSQLCCLIVFLQLFFLSKSQYGGIGCDKNPLFIFGDSTISRGHDGKVTSFRADYAPYGITRGNLNVSRFTNGYTFRDYLVEAMDLNKTGVLGDFDIARVFPGGGYNFAFGSAGILPQTGKAYGTTFGLDQQIIMFRDALKDCYLNTPQNISEEIVHCLMKATFVIAVGTNDYIESTVRPHLYNIHPNSTCDFAYALIQLLRKHLEDLYTWGARKFLLFQIGPLDKYPVHSVMNSTADEIIQQITTFNTELQSMADELSDDLPDSFFYIVKTYLIINELIESNNEMPDKNNDTDPCCEVKNGTLLCAPNGQFCEDTTTYLFWDALHLTEPAHSYLAKRYCDEKSVCSSSPIAFSYARAHSRPRPTYLAHCLILLLTLLYFPPRL
ncbi:GDSL lipase/esterase [Dillenia turbinata]|uniref:GDSL lipase/esterase n=1 Tax=Dillenia turbinata TaxID=194707 RepID=A0AAN8ZE85_9MAGN